MKVQVLMDKGALEWLANLRGDLPKTLATGVRRVTVFASDEVTRQIRGGATGIHPRSGGLAKAWGVRTGAIQVIEETKTGANGALRCNHPAARVLNEGSGYLPGGVIKPTRGKYLAIPLDAAKQPSGNARWASPMQVAGLILIRSKLGNLLLVRTASAVKAEKRLQEVGHGRGTLKGKQTTRKAPIVPFFVLKDSVRIPAFHYLDKTMEVVDGKSAQIMDETIQQAIDRRTA